MFPSRACSSRKANFDRCHRCKTGSYNCGTAQRLTVPNWDAIRKALRRAFSENTRSVFQMSPAGWVTQPQKGSIKLTGNSATEFPSGIDSPAKAIGGESWSNKNLRCSSAAKDSRGIFESHEPVSVHHIAARLGYSNDGYLQQKFPDLCAAISKRSRRGNRPTLRNCTEHWKMPLAKIHHPLG